MHELQESKPSAFKPVFENLTPLLIKYWHVLLLIALPLLITLINPNWIYNPDVLNDTDTWIYHGLFRYFFDFATTSPSNTHYFIERLSWVLPGYALYKLFTPVIANAILHLSVYYIALFAIYGTARQLFGQTPAFIAAICLGSYTWFLRASGHDYLDGAGIAYFSAAIWFATTATYRVRARWYLFGAGACLALALVTQLTWGGFAPVVALYYLLLKQRRHARIVIDGLWVAFGGLVILASLVLFNSAALGKWNIFSKSLGFVRATSTMSGSLREDILRAYAPTPSTWVALPCLMAICAVICLARWKRIEPKFRGPLRSVIISFSTMTGIYSFLHFSSPFQYFYIYLYASFLIPVTFLLLAGAVAASSPPSLSLRQELILLLLVLMPFVLIAFFEFFELVRLNVVIVWLVAGISMAFIAFGVLRGSRPFLTILAFSVLSFIISGHNGVAFHDRLHTYTRFVGVDAILESVDAQSPEMSRFSDYVIWNESKYFGAFAHAVRGISQPIPNSTHGTTLQTYKSSGYGNELLTDVIVLSDHDNMLERTIETLGDDYKITVINTAIFPSIDRTGKYRGYILRVERLHRYDTVIFPYGKNIRNTSASVAWTGPDSDVVMQFNLPMSASDIYIDLCGIMSILPLADEIPATVNDVQIIFLRQISTDACNFLYRAIVPQNAINARVPIRLALTIPTAPADLVFHNGDQGLYGMALTAVSFIQDTQIDRYNSTLVPRGTNIYPEPTQNGDIGPIFWTGDGSDVVMTFNLPVPTSDVQAELCGNMSIVTLDEKLDAAINGEPITFQRQPATEQCHLLYVADIPQTAITADTLTELAIIIPTAPADQVFQNGDMRPLGMALVSVSFNTEDIP